MKIKQSILFIALFLISTFSLQAQEDTIINNPDVSYQHFQIGMGNDIWMDAPDNNDIRPYNPSFVFSLSQVFHKENSPLGLSLGLGLQSNNLYNESFLVENQDLNKSMFSPIPDTLSFSKNKINTNYLELPVEIQLYLGKERKLIIAVGFKAGYLINSHTKYKGDDYLTHNFTSDDVVKIKKHNQRDLNNFRYTVTGRLGHGIFSIFGHYNLVPMFEEGKLVDQNDKPYEMSLLTVGLILTPF